MSNDTLQIRRIAIDTYHENVAYLHRDCGIYRAEGFQALSKIQVSTNGTKVLAVLNVVDDTGIVLPGELGLSEQAFAQLNATEGSLVTVNHAEPPKSMDAVRRKINGERLDQDDFTNIAKDIVEARYSKMEMAAFLVATGQNSLDRDELLYPIKIIST
jgi:thymidine phosphorylase